MKRLLITVTGQVQGVGFRPFIYKTALKHQLSGTVLNSPEGVLIELQGSSNQLQGFEASFGEDLPPLARIVTFDKKEIETKQNESEFKILASTAGEGHTVLISPDVATCKDCLNDIADPTNHRFEYPFTNCTNCGPRYTITKKIPYDRPVTSMGCFPLCPTCKSEYTDPLDRRFHAQPNACPTCGPEVWLVDNKNNPISSHDSPIKELANQLAAGKIAAVKGLGGFHLVCDASNQNAVQTLRSRKQRPHKPLAIMVKDLKTASQIGNLTSLDKELLSGLERPIVLAPKSKSYALSPLVAPDTDFIGLMVPYTPLHHILLKHFSQITNDPAALVMTSANMSGAPICIGNREAHKRLAHFADIFLFHNRDILIRVDDSVVRSIPAHNSDSNNTLFMRRARGYTPSPVFLAKSGDCVLGTGPELKNTLCLTKGNQAFPSQHIGDMQNLEVANFWHEINSHLQSILQVKPKLIVHDLHPDFMTTDFAKEISQSNKIKAIPLQHHFAHIHSVLAENKFQGKALGIALDGTGLGLDKNIWGGEILLVDNTTLEHQRIAQFENILLPGGEKSVLEPWRIAYAALRKLNLDTSILQIPSSQKPHLKMLDQIIDKEINCPKTSSCGRLFDLTAALLGLCQTISYEGQAAILLENIQNKTITASYNCTIDSSNPKSFIINTTELIAQVYQDIVSKTPVSTISAKFHNGLIETLAKLTKQLSKIHNTKHIGLSGGVMQNMTLATKLPQKLAANGLTPLVHKSLPPNDGCISLGQAVYGQKYLELNK